MSISLAPQPRPEIVEVLALSHSYRNRRELPVLKEINFSICAGEIICIVGPSGCGKTTLLQLIAGLVPLQNGQIKIDNGSKQRRVTLLFQDLRLFYWMTAQQNVSVALQASGIDRTRATHQAIDYLRRMGLEQFARCYPHELSGGMKQRLALARSLATAADVLLLDEPFSNLDQSTQEEIETDLLRVWREDGLTIVMVTHDLWEAVRLADRVLVLSSRPAIIRHRFDVKLARPRVTDTESLEIYRCIERLIHDA